MERGFVYLEMFMDWHSRYVLSWHLSNTLEAGFGAEALMEALDLGRPELSNTDQGSQFTRREFTQVLQQHGVKISMDEKGSYADNISWSACGTRRSEELYLKAYANAGEARRELEAYFRFFNDQRPHQALDTGPQVRCSTRPRPSGRNSRRRVGVYRNQCWYYWQNWRDSHLTPP